MTVDRGLFGDRDDPHAQARAARETPLLLHSLALFREVFEVVFANRKITTVVEIGVESGQVSSVYLDLGAVEVHCVDPTPSDALRATLAKFHHLHLVEEPSPAALASLPVADLYVVDGDHNYAVVRAEIDWIVANAPDAVIVLHDVLWPCSRRDLYYEPTSLGPDDLHPRTADGSTVWHDGVTPAGFVGGGAFSIAIDAGGERNGVLTAVEDGLAAAPDDWDLVIVPAVFGLGIAMRRGSDGATEVLDQVRPYTDSQLLRVLENNRLALYTRVLQMQYEMAEHAGHNDRLAELVNEYRRERDRLADQRLGVDDQLRRLREENTQLRSRMAGLRFRAMIRDTGGRLVRAFRR